MIQAYEIEEGQLLKPTRSSFPNVYYTIHRRSAKELIDKLSMRGKYLDTRDAWLLNRLKAGHIPLYRFTRRPGGAEQRETTVAPPDYPFRVINNKPQRRRKPPTQASLF